MVSFTIPVQVQNPEASLGSTCGEHRHLQRTLPHTHTWPEVCAGVFCVCLKQGFALPHYTSACLSRSVCFVHRPILCQQRWCPPGSIGSWCHVDQVQPGTEKLPKPALIGHPSMWAHTVLAELVVLGAVQGFWFFLSGVDMH